MTRQAVPAPWPQGRARILVAVCGSLGLHAALVAPWLLGSWTAPKPPQREQLVVDLFGMVSERQVEQQQAGREAAAAVEAPPNPTITPPPPPKPVARKEERVRRPRPPQSPASPVRIEVPADVPQPSAPSAAPSANASTPLAASPVATPGGEEDRAPQTVSARDVETDAIRRYLAGLKRAIQGRLAYPPEAKSAGQVGAPVIRFTLMPNGEILPGSLALQKSCGYAALDDSAMRAALAGAPFAPPPRQMNVAIAVAFVQDK